MTAQMARCDTDKTTNPLQTLAKVESEGLEAVNAIILAHMKSGVSLIPEIASYLIQAGGEKAASSPHSCEFTPLPVRGSAPRRTCCQR